MAESSKPKRSREMKVMEELFTPGSKGSLSEERLLCSICLDMLSEPVTTACGHNFCKTCLTLYWNKNECSCPYCKQNFTKRPELKINTTLRDIVDDVKMKSGGLNKTTGEVFCDYCTEVKKEALKTCLVCMTSYCELHLEPHQKVSALKKHKLINPVENLQDYICQKHERALELFCREDKMCVCQFCMEGEHRTHNTVPIEEESGERKTQLEKSKTELQQMIQERMKKIEEIKHSAELRKVKCNKSTEKETADSTEVFTALIRSIERSQAELLQVMEEKQKAAERQAEGLIKDLEQEITELKRRDTELEQLSHTEDNVHLLQMYPTLSSPPHTKNWTDININTDVNVETVRRALSQLQKTLNETLNTMLKQAVSRELKRIQEYSVDVTLDPDTAHPKLILSEDGKKVTHRDTKQNLHNNQKRFDTCSCVLGKEGFSSGRFYYEVQVKGKTKWTLGVARESVNRKGTITVSPQNGYWTVFLRNSNEYSAYNDLPVPFTLKQKPQTVGVFVDYEEGLVSFYDVETRSHIYSFTHQSFTEKLYPYFCPCNNDGGKNSAPLIISRLIKTE